MEIKVIQEEMHKESSMELGGEYATLRLDIVLDKSMSLRTQETTVIHAIIENYFPSLQHEKIEEITECIRDGLDQLNALKELEVK